MAKSSSIGGLQQGHLSFAMVSGKQTFSGESIKLPLLPPE